MSMKDWAENEVKLACKVENPDWDGKSFDYGCACYDSALKVFKLLCAEGHSNFSIKATQRILNRLIDGKPLTPIEDTEESWNLVDDSDETEKYQCKRMSSLFKTVHKDGSIEYSDNDRFYCINIHNHNDTYTCGTVHKILDEMYPISMPYSPSNKPYKIYCEEFLFDETNGDFDTMGIMYLITPDGERVDIEKFYKESERTFVEISKIEYLDRLKNKTK